jgi:hypothetical protein
LLEREGRIPEAIEAWQSILDWSRARDNKLDMEWPVRELERLRGQSARG